MKPATVVESIDAGEPVETLDIELRRLDEVPQEVTEWVDMLAMALAAGVRVGERGLHREPANDAGPAPPSRLRATHEPEVMDAEEVAAFLRVDRKTVYDYANSGSIPHQRLGKRLLFSRTALVAWLGACKAASVRQG